MTIFNTCTTKARINAVPQFEILVWIASVILYKQLGYKTKLFCSKEDLDFLKKEHIFELYDEIDDTFFDQDTNFSKINMSQFWSARKLEAINYQLTLDPASIYSDTDILMFSKLPIDNSEALFWTLEQNDPDLYIPWEDISKPNNFKYQDIYDTDEAYNCGLMWFKNKKDFDDYYERYLNFVIDNPCTLYNGRKDPAHNIFACNSEQRILKAVMDKNKTKVTTFASFDSFGFEDNGLHLFIFKRLWIGMDKFFNKDDPNHHYLEEMLNKVINRCLEAISSYDKNLYHFILSKKYFNARWIDHYE